MKAILNGRVLLPDSEVKGKALVYDERIVCLTDPDKAKEQADEIIDAQGAYVAPGLVDVHIHGYQNVDVSDNDPDDIRKMAHGLLENGVTSFLPTTLTVAWETLESVCRHIRGLMEESLSPDFDGAQIAGMHMEGPFINPAKRGAQNEAYILAPDADRVLP
ncbi:MAG: amidohydrolase family protein, partial [Clostridia bacterium]|nr:amidohydrolase family protein [Clostridia bacterium]